jgi:hypothetical protein
MFAPSHYALRPGQSEENAFWRDWVRGSNAARALTGAKEREVNS